MEAVRDPAPLGRSRCLTPLVCSPFAGGKSPHFVASSPSSSIYLAWAYGAGTSPTGYSFHGSSRGYISGFPTHAAEAGSGTAALAVHAAFMVLAWVGLAPLGIFTAALMKDTLHSGTWFWLHRGLQLGATVATFLGLIAIVVSGADLSTMLGMAHTHGAIGFAVIALQAPSRRPARAPPPRLRNAGGRSLVLQVPMAFLRNRISGKGSGVVYTALEANDDDGGAAGKAAAPKHPHGHRRWLFNALHKSMGYGMTVLALANIAIGVRLNDWLVPSVRCEPRPPDGPLANRCTGRVRHRVHLLCRSGPRRRRRSPGARRVVPHAAAHCRRYRGGVRMRSALGAHRRGCEQVSGHIRSVHICGCGA